jgi:dihydrofolate reductase
MTGIVYIDGGQTFRSFLSEGLVREMTITTAGVILGGGTPLFEADLPSADFSLVSTEIPTPQAGQECLEADDSPFRGLNIPGIQTFSSRLYNPLIRIIPVQIIDKR